MTRVGVTNPPSGASPGGGYENVSQIWLVPRKSNTRGGSKLAPRIRRSAVRSGNPAESVLHVGAVQNKARKATGNYLT